VRRRGGGDIGGEVGERDGELQSSEFLRRSASVMVVGIMVVGIMRGIGVKMFLSSSFSSADGPS